MTKVSFYDISFIPAQELTYSVISARYLSDWIFVRHNDRSTWEIPGGHVEPGEDPDTAAARELKEETGALKSDIECVATYSVEKNGRTGFGKLYFAEVYELGPFPDNSEIAEILLLKDLPKNLTYPDIQPHLYRKILEFIKEKGDNFMPE